LNFFVELFYQRKMGLKDGGVGSHVDLPDAWTDLALLSQCAGKLQEGILNFYPLFTCLFLYFMSVCVIVNIISIVTNICYQFN